MPPPMHLRAAEATSCKILTDWRNTRFRKRLVRTIICAGSHVPAEERWECAVTNFMPETIMTVSVKTLGIDRLNVDDRLALVEEIWASICVDAKAFPLTDMQRAELDRRVADDDAFPDDVIPWDEIKASARARLRR